MKVAINFNKFENKSGSPKCLIYLVGYDREYVRKDSPNQCRQCSDRLRCELQ